LSDEIWVQKYNDYCTVKQLEYESFKIVIKAGVLEALAVAFGKED
jgi:hypothetical protein